MAKRLPPSRLSSRLKKSPFHGLKTAYLNQFMTLSSQKSASKTTTSARKDFGLPDPGSPETPNQDRRTKSSPKSSLSRKLGRWALAAFFWFFLVGSLAASFLGFFWLSLGLLPDPLASINAFDYSVRVTDRHGRLLREVLPPPMNRRHSVELDNFSPILIDAVILAEDKRFWFHCGIDPLAMLRALRLNIASGSIKSGGSTISMQVARLSAGLAPGPKTIKRKLWEIWRALLIERHHTKEEILTLYLNTAPAGSINLGFEAASQAYLGHSASHLSPSEAAFLAGLPASPNLGRPLKPSGRAMARREMIIDRLEENGRISADAARRARSEPLILSEPRLAFRAPHFVEQILPLLGAHPPKEVTTTLDFDLEMKIEDFAKKTVRLFKSQGLTQVAVVVLSLPEREVMAWVGSADFFEPSDGQIDGVVTLRQPGSALKPFIYGLGLETGAITASSLLEDSTTDLLTNRGVYSPRNYSGASHGAVTARVALASSLNLPAINLTINLGVERILRRLNELGLNSLSHDADYYGVGLALGGGEVTLLDLTNAYAAMADEGRLKPPVFLRKASNSNSRPDGSLGRQVMTPEAAYIISDILADPLARATGFGSGGPLDTPYRAPVKTGTSKNFRDNWCLGYISGYAIGVWAGNFQATPMAEISGLTGAGQLWRAVADLLADPQPQVINMPPGVILQPVCPISGLPAGPNCPNRKMELMIKAIAPKPPCNHDHDQNTLNAHVVGRSHNFSLLSPQSGDIFAYDPAIPSDYQKIRTLVQSSPELDEIVFLVNGSEIARRQVSGDTRTSVQVPLHPSLRGRQTITVAGFSQGQEITRRNAFIEVK
ncbi:MAG: penicillin-binding protein 1C [Deltaproteobacteria bacterium]|jgi:penicillin-binding protein 1C|nr:penicillin-binding protein 1C [Deltaproteobacteria bacterium]